ncbi:MAG: sugar porter family MFS transporter [Myxococcales bacterium]|nr:sugar porter family MFS transporter [Myxococcales bacterium]
MTESGPKAPSPLARAVGGWLSRTSVFWFAIYAVVSAFTTYFCMYSFRRPFAAAVYEGSEFWVFDLKNALVISQLIGYALSKFVGIRFNSELVHRHRLKALVGLILWAELALLLFAVLPPGGKVLAIFLNGLPLGAVWGIVFSFLEGRRSSELLGAGLSCSYIVASGFVKSAGKWLMESGVPESWMPVATGAAFLPLFVIAAYALSLLPPPSVVDIEERSLRAPMQAKERRAFVRSYWPGLCLLVLTYLFLTSYRDFRENYAAEIWKEVGMGDSALIFTKTEVPIAAVVMLTLGLLYLIRDNRRGLLAAYVIMIGGSLLIGISTLLFDMGVIAPTWWMTLVGLGLYMGYVPYGCVLFDRKIAALQTVATAVFLIYISDAVAYGGSVLAVLYKELGQSQTSWLLFFRGFSYLTSVVCTAALVVSAVYFLRKTKRATAET